MRWRSSFRDNLVELALGLSLALIVVCAGLWLEAKNPTLPGTRPSALLHSVVSHLGFALDNKNRVPIKHLDVLGTDLGLQLSGTVSARRIIDFNGQTKEVRFDFVFGPLLQQLRVPLLGRHLSEASSSLPLASQPIREAVVSAALADQLYGSAEAALGKQLRVATMQWMLTGEDWAEYEIVGVADRRFQGTDIENPAQFWLGIDGWQDVLFPQQQIEDVRRHFGASTLTLETSAPERDAMALREALRRLGEPEATISLVPGAGYHPIRRARFADVGRTLMLGLGALTLILIICLSAFSLMRAERSRFSDHMRSVLGETPRARLLRQFRTGGMSAVVVGLAAVATLALVGLVDGVGLPLQAAITRGVQSVPIMAGVTVFGLVLASSHALLARRTSAIGLAGRRLASMVAILFAMLAFGLALAWFTGSVGALRLARVAASGLPLGVEDVTVTSIENSSRGWAFDPTDTRGLEQQLATVGIALASAGPVGPVIVAERGRVESQSASRSTVIPLNHVTANYFQVVGIAVRGACGPISAWGADEVYVNRRFLEAYGSAVEASDHRIRLDDGQVLRVCGVVANAHVTNARAGLAPMVYAHLNERRFMRVAVSDGSVRAGAKLAAALPAIFPEASPGMPITVRGMLRDQLRQERGVLVLSAIVLALSVLVGSYTALMLGRAAIAMSLRALATRRALGAPLGRLISTAVLGHSAGPWVFVSALTVIAMAGIGRLVGMTADDYLAPLLVALAASAGMAVVIGLRLVAGVDEHALVNALKAE